MGGDKLQNDKMSYIKLLQWGVFKINTGCHIGMNDA